MTGYEFKNLNVGDQLIHPRIGGKLSVDKVIQSFVSCGKRRTSYTSAIIVAGPNFLEVFDQKEAEEFQIASKVL